MLAGIVVILAALIVLALHSRPRHFGLLESVLFAQFIALAIWFTVWRYGYASRCQLNPNSLVQSSAYCTKMYCVTRIGSTSDTLGNRRILQAKRVPVPMKRQRVAVAGAGFAGL